jgi:hypothetical protein
VLGAQVIVGQKAVFVFRLRGHSWTEVLDDHDHYQWVQRFSGRLHTQAIFYYVTDTAGAIGYDFYAEGRLLERFECSHG